MKRILLLTLVCLSVVSSAHALSFAYPFVVLDGRVYEVLEVEVPENELGDVIGEVETLVNDETGRYRGDASNEYAIGTTYHAVSGESIEQVIAVEDGSTFKRAEYRHEAPFGSTFRFDWLAYAVVGIGLSSLVVTRMFKNTRHNQT